MPNVENVTAISGWMCMCINFVFGALVEYSYLLWVLKPSFLRCAKTLRANKSSDPELGGSGSLRSSGIKRHLVKVDDVCLVTFPLLFFIFNVGEEINKLLTCNFG